MNSSSAGVSAERPFYTRHAEVYDAVVTDPVGPWVTAVHHRLPSSGPSPVAVLDAGCGTGRHAAALMALGHRVELLDASVELLAIARRRCPGVPAHHLDICHFSLPHHVDAVTCRGVLNDLLTDDERDAALTSLADVLTDGGWLFLDVRDRERSRGRADGRLRQQEAVLDSGAQLVFTSRPTWRAGIIEVAEHHQLSQPDGDRSTSSYAFRMRPWTTSELHQRLGRAGFEQIEVGSGHGRRAVDRLFVTARRSTRAPAR